MVEINPQFRASHFQFYRLSLAEGIGQAASGHFRIGKAGILDYLLGLFQKDLRISLSRSFRRGDDYFVARLGWRIAAIARICYADTQELKLHPGEASLISFYTVPRYRGRGLFVALVREMAQDLRLRGYVTAFVWADQSNMASIRSINKAGFKPFSVGE